MRWSMLPVSVAAHAAAVIGLVVIPLAADTDLPVPPSPWRRVEFVAARTVPDVPREQPGVSSPVAAPRAVGAPIHAPSRIDPEVPVRSDLPDIPGALPADDLGLTAGSPAVLGDVLLPPAPPPPPPPPRPPQPVRPGGHIRAPEKVAHVAPRYPDVARIARIEGLVILEAIIDERGIVTQIRVLRSVPLLDGAAIEAVRQWRYTPTLLNGMPVPVIMTITCRFSLSADGPPQ